MVKYFSPLLQNNINKYLQLFCVNILEIVSFVISLLTRCIYTFRQKEIARVRRLSDVKAPEVPIHNEHLRPGFCRVSLPYFMSEAEVAFILEALKMVATEGWKILPQYVVNAQTGQWRHHTCSVLRDKKSLYSLKFKDGKVSAHERRVSGKYFTWLLYHLFICEYLKFSPLL